MKNRIAPLTAVFLLTLSLLSGMTCHGVERKSRYITLQYSDLNTLKEFNNKLYLGRSLRNAVRRRNPVTTEDEVAAKLDAIIEKAMVVLDMYPNDMSITVVLVPKAKDIHRIFKTKYGQKCNDIAFYSLAEDTIYLSADHGTITVVAHEMGHAVVDHYFKVQPPSNIHELMAQFTSKHIND